METIKDLWASMVAYVNERSTNPLTSAFFLTWAGWNYKFFVLLFEDVPSAEKFSAIDKLYPRPETYYGSGLLYPALTALFYVFLYPYVTSRVVTFYRARQVEIANKVKAIEGGRIRTAEDVARLVRRYEGQVAAADADQKVARAEAGELRDALANAETEIKNLRANISTRPSQLRFPNEDQKAQRDNQDAAAVEQFLSSATGKRDNSPKLSTHELSVMRELIGALPHGLEVASIAGGHFFDPDEINLLLDKLKNYGFVTVNAHLAHITPFGVNVFKALEAQGDVPKRLSMGRL